MRIIRLILLVLIFQANLAIAEPMRPFTLPFHNNQFDKKCCLVIAHAGGGLAGQAYTNSKEALDANYALGRQVFEIDFNVTSDGFWVLSHDWDSWAINVNREETKSHYEAFRDTFSRKAHVPTQAEFIKSKSQAKFTLMTLDDLVAWLKVHPDAIIITDSKRKFPDFFKSLHAYKDIQKQIVFQAYSAEDIALLKRNAIPLEQVIFTNYKARLSENELIDLFGREKIGALTIPFLSALNVSENFMQEFAKTPIYVHGGSVNSAELQTRLSKKGISGFYLD